MNRFVIANPGRCIGCNTCMAACSSVHRVVGLQAMPRLTVMRTLEITAPIQCRHCEDAPCARVCPVDAIRIGDHRVDLNEQACIGCKLCAIACPFGAITPSGTSIEGFAAARVDKPSGSAGIDPLLAWNIGVRSVAVKCDLCSFQDAGPECVRVCPTEALRVVNGNELDRANAEKRLASATNTPAATGFEIANLAAVAAPSTEERN